MSGNEFPSPERWPQRRQQVPGLDEPTSRLGRATARRDPARYRGAASRLR
ncbi:MAG: hypothetical protein QM673_14795 [Gordonia sp. (in: high G+C Gram-positive bacteria)]